MRIGIGLPNTVPGNDPQLIPRWAQRAEERGFQFVSTVGRVGYPSYDSLTTLAAVAGGTSRIELLTNAVLGPTYPDAVLAKIAMTLAQLSGDRLTLGLGVGARESDYAPSDRDFSRRGRMFDQQLQYLHRAFRGEELVDGEEPGEKRAVAPCPPGSQPPPILIGGHSEAAVRRTVEWGAGWTGAGGGPERARPVVESLRERWDAAGREGRPRLLGLVYFSVGDDVVEESDRYIRSYYRFAGEMANTVAEQAVRTRDEIRGVVERFAAAGMNELVFTPTVPRLDQVDGLAEHLDLG